MTSLALTSPDFPGEGTLNGPEWSRDGKKLFYYRRTRAVVANRKDITEDAIVELDIASGKERIVVHRESLWEFWLSPDNQFLVTRLLNQPNQGPVLLLVSVADGHSTELMHSDPGQTLGVWAWSPDSRSVLLRKRSSEFWRVAVDGTPAQEVPLVVDPTMSKPRTSPDGFHMAFMITSPAKAGEVWVLERFLPPPTSAKK